MLGAFKVIAGLVLGIPAAIILLIVGILLYCQLRNFYLFRKRGCTVPAAPERPLLGSFILEEPHLMDVRYTEQIGPYFYWTLLHVPAITVIDADVAQLVLTKENFQKSVFHNCVGDFAGHSLVTFSHAKGGPWKEHRDLVNPAFKVANLRAMTPIFARHAIRFTEKLLTFPVDDSIDFRNEIAKLTLDVISAAGFSHELGSFGALGKENPILSALQNVLHQFSSPLLPLPFGASHILPYLQKDNLAVVNKLLYGVIDKRIKERETGKKDPSRIPDLLDMMMEPGENGKQLTREELRNELLIFYLAGHETTATTLSWTIYELAKNPEVYQKLVDEVDSVMEYSDNVVCPSPEDLDKMAYMTLVFNETLRKYPPVIGNSRTIDETFEHNGYVFPKGYMITISLLGLGRSEKYWPDPMKYDPERFTQENSVGRHPYSFIPFSAGPRICIGKNFFFLEAKAILATMLRKVSFELDPTKESGRETSPSGFFKPNAVWIKLTKRVK